MEPNYCGSCKKYRNGKCHKAGWKWSERLGKCRRPAIREFMMDRQGIHIVLGLVYGLFFAVPAWLWFLYDHEAYKVGFGSRFCLPNHPYPPVPPL